jgi:hypothetical protein
MTENWGDLLREEWAKHGDWSQLGKFVSSRLVESYRSGFTNGERQKAIDAIEGLIKVLKA